jgi:hypothetical protein
MGLLTVYLSALLFFRLFPERHNTLQTVRMKPRIPISRVTVYDRPCDEDLTNPFFVIWKGGEKRRNELNLKIIVKTGAQETSIEHRSRSSKNSSCKRWMHRDCTGKLLDLVRF